MNSHADNEKGTCLSVYLCYVSPLTKQQTNTPDINIFPHHHVFSEKKYLIIEKIVIILKIYVFLQILK